MSGWIAQRKMIADARRQKGLTVPGRKPSRPIKIPKSVIDLIGPLTLSPFLCVSEDRKSTRLNSSH